MVFIFMHNANFLFYLKFFIFNNVVRHTTNGVGTVVLATKHRRHTERIEPFAGEKLLAVNE